MTLGQNFIYVFFEIIMILTMLMCIKIISIRNLRFNIFKIIFALIIAQIIIINNMYIYTSLKIFVSLILSVFVIKIFFNTNYKDAISYTIIYFLVTYILELILSLTLILFDMKSFEIFNNTIIVKSIFSIIHMILTLILFKIKKVNILIKKLYKLLNDNFIHFILIIIFVLNIITIYRCSYLNNTNIISLTFTILTFIIITFIIIINDKYNIIILKNRNKNLKDSYKAYSKTIEDYKTLKHNLRNELYSIKTSLPQPYQDKIDKLIIKNNKDLDWVTKLNDIPEGIQGIIFLKKQEGEKYKIKFYINSNKKVNIGNEDYLDLCEIVGILIDNAIDASKNEREKIIFINIIENNNYLKIEIINIFNHNINLTKLGHKNYSTKKTKSGIGLNYINKLKNNNIKINYEIINNIFKVKIIYSNKQNKKSLKNS